MGNRVIAPSHFPRKIDQYVPAMSYEAGMAYGEAVEISLGTPKVADPDGILDGKTASNAIAVYDSTDFETTFDGSSSSLTSESGKMDAPYGRTVDLVGNSGADNVTVVVGRDYLGQVVSETYTLSGTTAQPGKKAFKYVDTITLAVGTASKTIDVGWGVKLGLPYKLGKLLHARENGIYIAPHEELIRVGPSSAVTLSGANSANLVAPRDGWVIGFDCEITTATTVGPSAIDVVVAGTGVGGLDFVVGWGTSTETLGMLNGTRVAPGLTNADVVAGDIVTVLSDGGSTAGAGIFTMLMTPGYGHHSMPIITDPSTNALGDVRGTYTPFTTLDGSREILVTMRADNSINSSDNGGLHGIKQV